MVFPGKDESLDIPLRGVNSQGATPFRSNLFLVCIAYQGELGSVLYHTRAVYYIGPEGSTPTDWERIFYDAH